MIVVVRDPRNVVISEYRMRQNVYGQDVGDLDAFVKIRFEVGDTVAGFDYARVAPIGGRCARLVAPSNTE